MTQSQVPPPSKPFPVHFLIGCGTIFIALMSCGSCGGGAYFFDRGNYYERRASLARYSRYSILGPSYYQRKANSYKTYGVVGFGAGVVMLLVAVGAGVGTGMSFRRYSTKVKEATPDPMAPPAGPPGGAPPPGGPPGAPG